MKLTECRENSMFPSIPSEICTPFPLYQSTHFRSISIYTPLCPRLILITNNERRACLLQRPEPQRIRGQHVGRGDKYSLPAYLQKFPKRLYSGEYEDLSQEFDHSDSEGEILSPCWAGRYEGFLGASLREDHGQSDRDAKGHVIGDTIIREGEEGRIRQCGWLIMAGLSQKWLDPS